jgi:hypothetical protein
VWTGLAKGRRGHDQAEPAGGDRAADHDPRTARRRAALSRYQHRVDPHSARIAGSDANLPRVAAAIASRKEQASPLREAERALEQAEEDSEERRRAEREIKRAQVFVEIGGS